jgi:hypothetical protein
LSPAEIPGVRIAYVGQTSGASEHMSAYWQARRASFRQLTLASHVSVDDLHRLPDWAHVVVHSHDAIAAPQWRRIEVYCDRAEKPLIAINHHGVSDLAEALVGWCPLA